ncbi:MAG TPA: hypothetical protein VNF28_04760 [Candidatus Binataceae bacterium]|nr:hypothetical protein [Candidatus Binataceae bacterium]
MNFKTMNVGTMNVGAVDAGIGSAPAAVGKRRAIMNGRTKS